MTLPHLTGAICPVLPPPPPHFSSPNDETYHTWRTSPGELNWTPLPLIIPSCRWYGASLTPFSSPQHPQPRSPNKPNHSSWILVNNLPLVTPIEVFRGMISPPHRWQVPDTAPCLLNTTTPNKPNQVKRKWLIIHAETYIHRFLYAPG